jgi:hypothetical protein
LEYDIRHGKCDGGSKALDEDNNRHADGDILGIERGLNGDKGLQ